MATTRKPTADKASASAPPKTKATKPKDAGKSAAVKPSAPTKARVAASSASRSKASAAARDIPAEQRAHYVEVAAYYIAERRGFAPGDPMADWLAAEVKIDRLIAEGKLG